MIILASQSQRRQELLNQIKVPHQVLEVEVDETPFRNESPRDYVRRVSLEKAQAGRQLMPDKAILAADTCVVKGNNILGKPQDMNHALAMLQQLSATTHEVLTGVALLFENQEYYRLSSSQVQFHEITPDEARRYWETGEPQGKAGGYAIQGMGALFIEHIAGSYSGIMGLPLFETGQLLEKLYGKTGQYS